VKAVGFGEVGVDVAFARVRHDVCLLAVILKEFREVSLIFFKQATNESCFEAHN